MPILNIFSRVGNFFKEVRIEIKKVNWPTLNQTIRYTLIVIGVSIVTAVFLGGADKLFSEFLNRFIL